MTARAELSVREARQPGAAHEVAFSCPHGLVTLPVDANDVAGAVTATLRLHDELRGPGCTGQAWAALHAGALPVPGATASPN